MTGRRSNQLNYAPEAAHCIEGRRVGAARVPEADWTYEVAPAGSPAAGLEEYVVVSALGGRVGKVTTLLSRDGELYVAVERGNPPVTHDVRAFPWRDVERVDHEALTVELKLADDAIEASLELDPDKGVEDGEADAVRVTELPAEAAPSSSTSPDSPGPVDRPTYALAIGLGALGLFALLVLFIAALTVEFTWHFALFAIPALLLALAGAAGYRAFRSPYERR